MRIGAFYSDSLVFLAEMHLVGFTAIRLIMGGYDVQEKDINVGAIPSLCGLGRALDFIGLE